MNRREVIKGAALGAVGAAVWASQNEAVSQTYAKAARGLPPLKITKVKAIQTAPNGTALTVVKVETSEPGLYGVGCASLQPRQYPVAVVVNEYLDPFARGKDPANIEDMWQTAYVSSYWRNGPVLNNSLSGLDMALWDIKAKRCGVPLYQLLGGKCRFAVECYGHADAPDLARLEANVKRYMSEGFRHVRIQLGGYGSPQMSGNKPDYKEAGFGMAEDGFQDTLPYTESVPKMFEHIRKTCGEKIELIHDIHERVHPLDAINMIKAVTPYRPFAMEDPFAPEDNGYFRILRQQSSVPIFMGELFTNPQEWVPLISERLIDYIRVHISHIGGITPALKIARLAEWFNVRTAWHGPGNVSPIGHSVNAHIDLAIWNFGIQESVDRNWPKESQEVFPGCPTFKNGYMFVNEVPGHGVDVDERAAAKYPYPPFPQGMSLRIPVRKRDGSAIRP
jgi:mannonate dehydratase